MVTFQTDRHIFLAGKTRSGKTVLIQSVLHALPRVVVHDRKNEWGGYAARNHYYVIHTPEELYELLQKGAKRIVYMPAVGGDEMADFDMFCEVLFHTGNVTVIIDEAASYCMTSTLPKWTSELMRLGNGLGTGCWSLTQRPRDVSNVLLSESVIVVAFRLALKTDRTKIIQTVGTHINDLTLGAWREMISQPTRSDEKLDNPVTVNEVLRTLPAWHFIMYDSETEKIHVCAPVQMK